MIPLSFEAGSKIWFLLLNVWVQFEMESARVFGEMPEMSPSPIRWERAGARGKHSKSLD